MEHNTKSFGGRYGVGAHIGNLGGGLAQVGVVSGGGFTRGFRNTAPYTETRGRGSITRSSYSMQNRGWLTGILRDWLVILEEWLVIVSSRSLWSGYIWSENVLKPIKPLIYIMEVSMVY